MKTIKIVGVLGAVFLLAPVPGVRAQAQRRMPPPINQPPQASPPGVALTRALRREQRGPSPLPLPRSRSEFGDPLPNLAPAELAAFVDGKDDFEQEETVATGLGPIFNNVSCAACHSVPGTGGSSDIVVTRFGRNVNGHFDPLASQGGSLLQQFAIDPALQEVVPAAANVVAHRQTTPLFGVGLIEAIPDGTILQNASRRKPFGIAGRVSVVQDVATGQTRIGRFGWKAQHAGLLSFSADAYLNEIGITSRFFPVENAPNGNTALLALFDPLGDPEDEVDAATGKSDIDRAADFMRFLAPPPTLPQSRTARMGEAVFQQLGCAVCHVPSMSTGFSPVSALSHRPVELFSDLLLHDMGSLGDGIAQGTAGPREMKTAPLWGLRAKPAYLHDGRAATVDAAIRAHDGEAREVRNHYLQLSPAPRSQVLDYLNSL